MRQLVVAYERDLATLPIQHARFVFQVREFHLRAGWKYPLKWLLYRPGVELRVKLHRLIPKAAGVAHLRCIPPEDDRVEVFIL